MYSPLYPYRPITPIELMLSGKNILAYRRRIDHQTINISTTTGSVQNTLLQFYLYGQVNIKVLYLLKKKIGT